MQQRKGFMRPKPPVLPDFIKQRTHPRDYLSILLAGLAMGSADVVPGVSGGTIAFIVGIYEELLGSIRMVGRPVVWRALLQLRWREAFRLINLPFLAVLGSGILGAIVVLAPGIEWMLVNQPVLIWSFFFGLVVASIVLVVPRVKQWAASRWVALLLGTVGAYWLVGLVPVQTPDDWWFLIFSGAVAICAMILPGISGSFILVLLGKYQFFINAINTRDLVSLALGGIGVVVGLVSFAQILTWLFRRYHDLTVAALIGLMIGSLRKVWPWKEVIETMVDRHGDVVPLVERNLLPSVSLNGSVNPEVLWAVGAALLGIVVLFGVEWIATRRR
jgi:putative membrane protein